MPEFTPMSAEDFRPQYEGQKPCCYFLRNWYTCSHEICRRNNERPEREAMIAITTNNGKLYGVFELDIPEGQNWSPNRLMRLMAEIERYVFISELADKADNEARKNSTLPSRKANFKSGLVIDA